MIYQITKQTVITLCSAGVQQTKLLTKLCYFLGTNKAILKLADH